MPLPSDARSIVGRYHDGTKHSFHRFARSLGYLDWASQPRPFRTFAGAPRVSLWPAPTADPGTQLAGDILRHSLGLSAWKRFGNSRWSLRVNPSSGNLHPTETYLIGAPIAGKAATTGVYHYAPDHHALEQRCLLDPESYALACDGRSDVLLIALTSIHWREAWKYGERAFRYCQHDLGHAIAAVSYAASMAGLCAEMLPGWSHEEIAWLTGINRDEDFVDAEREEPACVIALSPIDAPWPAPDERRSIDVFREALQRTSWQGLASQLSEDHVQWTFIDEVARVTTWPGWAGRAGGPGGTRLRPYRAEAMESRGEVSASVRAGGGAPAPVLKSRQLAMTRELALRRRSALAFDGQSRISQDRFLALLEAVMPGPTAPWSALWWPAAIHLALFVHRVDGVAPGLYVLVRSESAVDRLRSAMQRDFLWNREQKDLPFYCLARGDCRRLAHRLSCDQDIAADGYFSFGMLVEFDATLDRYGPAFYRHLFWESGVVGQAMYVAAEADGSRATGIGCFYDDPVHETLGLADHTLQSLYHFTVGFPVEDTRLTTERGYGWETLSPG